MMTYDIANLPEDDAEALSILTAALYDAAIDQSLWPVVMAAVTRFMAGYSTVIYDWASTGGASRFVHDDGVVPDEFKSLYLERYSHLDAVTASNDLVAVDEAFNIADALDIDRYRRSRFYREWAGPQGIIDLLVAPVRREGASTLLFGAIRGERDGMADDRMRRRMKLLVPHVRRALQIERQLGEAPARADALAAVLDHLEAGLFLLDADGRVVHANAAGEAALSDKLAVTSRDGRFTTLDASASRVVNTALAAAGDASRSASTPILGRDGSHFAAHIVPIAAGSAFDNGRAAAAVFVHPAEFSAPPAADLAGRAFELTGAERRVLAHIVEAGSVAEAAARLRLSEATVKTHLKHIFAKTGTARQPDLVRLIAGFAGPLLR